METSGLNLYTFNICPFCKPVEYLLNSNNIQHNYRHLDLLKYEQKSEEFLKINPIGKVPALIDEGFVIFESNTVMRYICNTRDLEDHWYPKNPQKRALVDLYFDWHAQNVEKITKYTYTSIGYNNLTKEEAKAITDKGLADLENVFLSKHKFIASEDKVTIADLALVWHFRNLEFYGYELPNRIREYYEVLKTNLHGIVEDFDDFDKKREEYVNAKKSQ